MQIIKGKSNQNPQQRAAANSQAHMRDKVQGDRPFVDNRPGIIAQRQLLEIANINPRTKRITQMQAVIKASSHPFLIQRKPRYNKINYNWGSGDTGTCVDKRMADNSWSEKQNLGLKSGDRVDKVYYGRNSDFHSEEKVVANETGTTLSTSDTVEQNAEKVKTNMGGKEVKIDLYTETNPCYGGLGRFNCQKFLNSVLTDSSEVTFSFYSQEEKKKSLEEIQKAIIGNS